MNSLKGRIEEITANYKFQQSDSDHSLQPVKLHLQHLPEKMWDNHIDPADFPFILLIMGGGTIGEDLSGSCNIGIMVGAYDGGIAVENGIHDNQGWMIPTEIIWRIISDLTQNPTVDKRYVLQRPLTWELPEEQPAPQWIGTIYATFSIPVIPPEHHMDYWATPPVMEENFEAVQTLKNRRGN
jgi:hypothetical protein